MAVEKRYIRLRNSFSDRNRIKSIDRTIQINDFSAETRIVIKNKILILLDKTKQSLSMTSWDFENRIKEKFCVDLFNIPLDSNECTYENVLKIMSELLDNGSYDEILSLIEYLNSALYVID